MTRLLSILSLLAAMCILPYATEAQYPSVGNTGGSITYPAGSAEVRTDCTNASMSPCFETICGAVGSDDCAAGSAIAYLEGILPAGNRILYLHPGTYPEDVSCDLNTGNTSLIGLGEIGDAGSTHGMPTIVGVTGGRTYTIQANGCTIDRLLIEQGPDAFDIAIQTTPGIINNGVRVSNSYVRNNSVAGGGLMGNTERLWSFTQTTGSVEIKNTRTLAVVSGCTNDCAMFYQNTDRNTVVEILGGDHNFFDISPADGGAVYELDKGWMQAMANFMVMGTNGTATNSIFEIDDSDATLILMTNTAPGLNGVLGTPALDIAAPRLITVVGSDGGSRVYMSDAYEAESFSVASVWGPVVPIFRGPLKNVSVASTLVNHADAEGFVSLDDGAWDGGVNDDVVDDYVMAAPSLARRLHVKVATAPDVEPEVATESWTYTLMVNDVATALTCTISETATSCDSKNALDGIITAVGAGAAGCGTTCARITSTAHGLSTGDTVYIRATPNTYDGPETVTWRSADTFDITTATGATAVGDWIRYDSAAIIGAGAKLSMKVTNANTPTDDTETIISMGVTGFPK